MNYQVPIHYSEKDQSPYFQYVDDQGIQHVVWFEDARSMSVKSLLIREFKIEGAGVWQLTLSVFQKGLGSLQTFPYKKVLDPHN